MPGNGDCMSLTNTGPTHVCVRAGLAGAQRLEGAQVNSAPAQLLYLTRGHPSSPGENPVSWTCSSGTCTGNFDAGFTGTGAGLRLRSRHRLQPPACTAPRRQHRAPLLAVPRPPPMGSGYVGRRCEGTGAAGSRCRRGARRGQATPDSMGGCESSHSGRRVSFGVDEREQVRVVQGIRLTEDVVNRMKGSPQSKRCFQRSPRASNGTAPSSLAAGVGPRSPEIQPPKASDSAAEHELYRRYEQEQALVQEELLHLARREREAACEAKERNSINEERQRTAQMAMELQDREAELKLQEDFYKDQLARIEKKNAEIYKLTSEQYQEAAAKAEEQIKNKLTLLQNYVKQNISQSMNEVQACLFPMLGYDASLRKRNQEWSIFFTCKESVSFTTVSLPKLLLPLLHCEDMLLALEPCETNLPCVCSPLPLCISRADGGKG
uniref:Coiled-coil-helix-coiled-coil-helix domain containing 6 n=1 Tax=Cyanistes caeruleus TaxID=156563 RepID=A0A8C0VNH6_CYACU